MLSKIDLLGGDNVPLMGLCTLRPPRLNDMRSSSGIGENKYQQCLGLIAVTLDDLIQSLDLLEWFNTLAPDEQNAITEYDLMVAVPNLRESLADAISFFTLETPTFDEEAGGFIFCTQDEAPSAVMTSAEYADFRDAVCEMCCVSFKKRAPIKFRSEKERLDYERCQKKKRSVRPKPKNPDMELSNIVSAVAASGNGYTLLNIWDLTLYQLYDQFQRINTNVFLNAYAVRWGAWGQDKFDFELWYKNIEKEK